MEDTKFGSKSEISKLYVSTSIEGTSLFIDRGVYTKNRQFRLIESSKIGKVTSLKVSNQNKYPLRNENDLKLNGLSRSFFFATLVGHIVFTSSTRLLTCSPNKIPKLLNMVIQQDSVSKPKTSKHSKFITIDHFLISVISKSGLVPTIKSVLYYDACSFHN